MNKLVLLSDPLVQYFISIHSPFFYKLPQKFSLQFAESCLTNQGLSNCNTFPWGNSNCVAQIYSWIAFHSLVHWCKFGEAFSIEGNASVYIGVDTRALLTTAIELQQGLFVACAAQESDDGYLTWHKLHLRTFFSSPLCQTGRSRFQLSPLFSGHTRMHCTVIETGWRRRFL